MVAKHETPATPESADAPARYWPGYDTLHDEIARANARLPERDRKKYRDGWWRFNIRNKLLAPLETAERYRRAGTHALILNRRPHGSETEEHHCSCGLIVDMPARPDLLTAELLEERDTIFFTAPGHIDWRMRDAKHYPAPERAPELTLNSSEEEDRRKYFWELDMYLAFYGPPPLHKLARSRGQHLPIRTYWSRLSKMPHRYCTCGLKVEAPDLAVLRDDMFHTDSPGTYWPNDPVERERIQRAFFEAKGHKKLPVQNSESDGDSE